MNFCVAPRFDGKGSWLIRANTPQASESMSCGEWWQVTFLGPALSTYCPVRRHNDGTCPELRLRCWRAILLVFWYPPLSRFVSSCVSRHHELPCRRHSGSQHSKTCKSMSLIFEDVSDRLLTKSISNASSSANDKLSFLTLFCGSTVDAGFCFLVMFRSDMTHRA